MPSEYCPTRRFAAEAESDGLEHLVHAALRDAEQARVEQQRLPAGAARVLGGGVEHDPDDPARGSAARRTACR